VVQVTKPICKTAKAVFMRILEFIFCYSVFKNYVFKNNFITSKSVSSCKQANMITKKQKNDGWKLSSNG